MFWDRFAGVYDLFENAFNRKVYQGTGEAVAKYIGETDVVLECACGTGAITKYLAPKCLKILATDFSAGMLKQAKKNCRNYDNLVIRRADLTKLKIADERFDKVVAGNVIHLLPDPKAGLRELERVCKEGGKIILPTYINLSKPSNMLVTSVINKLGAGFQKQFDLESYKQFFDEIGYTDVYYEVVNGRMPCAIAVITKKKIK